MFSPHHAASVPDCLARMGWERIPPRRSPVPDTRVNHSATSICPGGAGRYQTQPGDDAQPCLAQSTSANSLTPTSGGGTRIPPSGHKYGTRLVCRSTWTYDRRAELSAPEGTLAASGLGPAVPARLQRCRRPSGTRSDACASAATRGSVCRGCPDLRHGTKVLLDRGVCGC